jgi:pyrimidine operon attenuation protein/uracil phosphoribosyltransferase
MDLGRPRRVWLSVLVDRGGRELPIAADHIALDLRLSADLPPNARVDVHLQPTDPVDEIVQRDA